MPRHGKPVLTFLDRRDAPLLYCLAITSSLRKYRYPVEHHADRETDAQYHDHYFRFGNPLNELIHHNGDPMRH